MIYLKRWLYLLLSGFCLLVVAVFISKNSQQPAWAIPWLALAIASAAAAMRTETNREQKIAIGLLLFLWLAVTTIMVPIFESAKPVGAQIACMSNIKRLSVGLTIYREDFDDHLPPAQVWRSASDKYVHSDGGVLRCSKAESAWTYAMNSNFSGKPITAPEQDPPRVLLFESDSSTQNATGTLNAFVPRHYGNGSIGFTDGSVGLRTMEELSSRWGP